MIYAWCKCCFARVACFKRKRKLRCVYCHKSWFDGYEEIK